ncbi:MAG TPA: flagellar hook-associated protein FlgK [Peptococcaceae bacterium]|nr:MAG: Flagellar hook-associated protein [Clostridia bacterium 41_269]HBT20196.1 flagellar hook-associated protein FlgK [Peptococcaceae bacterium]
MTSTFSGFSISLRALMSQKLMLDIAAHNVANASTPGFTRQRGVLETTPPLPYPSISSSNLVGQIGTGVDVVRVERLRNEFLDVQRRKEIHTRGQWAIKRDTLEQIEVIFLEPTDTGLSSLLNEFWSSWQELSKNPESLAVRTTVKETAAALADAIRHTYQQLKDLSDDIDNMIKINVRNINSLATQIDRLNKQIKAAKGAGFEPNDLYDQRDKLVDELAELIDFKYKVNDDGTMDIYLYNEKDESYSARLVDGIEGHTNTLKTADYTSGKTVILWDSYISAEPSGSTPAAGDVLGVSDDTDKRAISDGKLKGLFDARDVLLKGYMETLNSFALGLINVINEYHKNGYDLNGNAGGEFFSGTGATDITISDNIESDVSRIAAALYSETIPGDGSNALRIAELQSTRLFYDSSAGELRLPGGGEMGNTSFEDFYNNLISSLGVATNESQRMLENQEALVDQLNNLKENISGVSIDEEVAYMLQYLRAYQAAARFMTAMDEILDTLINRTAV